MAEEIIVQEQNNEVIISSVGEQGPSGRTILNGSGAPSDSVGAVGDFYYDTTNYKFYGPKLSSATTTGTWSGSTVIPFNEPVAFEYSWGSDDLVPHDDGWSITINHGLLFRPNVLVKAAGSGVLETGVQYNNLSSITLTMTEKFSGTAYLS